VAFRHRQATTVTNTPIKRAVVLQHTRPKGPGESPRCAPSGAWPSRAEDDAFVLLANGPMGGPQITADTAGYFAQAQPIWDQLLRNILGELLLAGSCN
jgi:hypothetical protein